MNHSQKLPQNNYGFALKILAFYVFAALLVLLAFFIPQIIFKYEDRKTSNYDIHYTAEKVDLAEGGISLYEKLSSMPDYYSEGSYIPLDPNQPRNFESRLTPTDVHEKGINDFVDVFVGNSLAAKLKGNDEAISKAGGLSEYLKGLQFVVTPTYMIRTVNRDMFFVWDLYIYDDDFGNLDIYIDDETGKILSFDFMTNNFVNAAFMNEIDSKNLTGRIGSYYNLSLQNVKASLGRGFLAFDMNFKEDLSSNRISFINLKMISVDFYENTYNIYFNRLDDSYSTQYDNNQDYDDSEFEIPEDFSDDEVLPDEITDDN